MQIHVDIIRSATFYQKQFGKLSPQYTQYQSTLNSENLKLIIPTVNPSAQLHSCL